MKPLTAIALFILLILLGCKTSQITSSWQPPNATPKAFNKIMVLGLIRDADRSIRENMENHLVADLKELGYNAYSSYAQFGPKAFENLSEEQVYDRLKQSGADAVLTIVLLNKEKEKHYEPGRMVYSPYAVYYHRFGGYYTTLITRIETPGYYTESTRYFWESNLYDLNTRELIYSVQTQSFDPSSTESLGHEYGEMIVKDMAKRNVLRKPGPSEVKPI